MIQRQLSKAQGHVIDALVSEQLELRQRLADNQAAVNEQIELLRARYDLPEGEATFQQTQQGWALVVKPAAQEDAEDDA